MATLKQIDANRRNSQLSTGPHTPEGKQAASQNALKTGVHAEAEVIFSERREDLETLSAEYHARFRPTTPEARDLVDSLTRHTWLLRRLSASEASLFNCQCTVCQERYAGASTDQSICDHLVQNFKRLDLIQRRINSTERNYHRSLKALRELPESPEPTPQPVALESTSAKLASFPQTNSPEVSLRESAPPLLRVPPSTNLPVQVVTASVAGLILF